MLPEPERGHLQDDRRQVGAQDLRLGELRAGVEVLLRVQPDAGARRDAPAPAGSLGGGGLRDRLDGKPLHLGAAVVPGDAGRARIDHADDPRHRERRLGHVGRQHDPAAGVRREHAVLLGGRQAGVQREELHAGEVEARQRVGGVADVALAGQEHEQVAGPLAHQLPDGVDDGLGLVAVVALVLADRPVADLHRVRASGHLHHRRVAEVRREARGVDGGRGDDHLQIGPLRQQLAEVAEEEVDVEAALVGLVDDQHLVGAEVAVALDLGEQDAVGHHLDEGVLADAVVEADGEADRIPDLGAELLGDALRHRPGGQPPGLRVTDEAAHTEAELEAQLRQLRALARSRLAGDDHHLVVADRLEQHLAVGDDREVGVGGHREALPAPGHPLGVLRGGRGHCRLEGFCCTWAFTAFVKPRS